MNINIFENKIRRLDLEKFIDTRCLICANSGGGKSYAVRKLLEEANDKVVCVVLDIEGEFKTLREKYDFLLIGDGGDVELNQKVAKLLPKKLLGLNIPAIIDISELKRKERILYVKAFLESLMDLPKKFWKPCIVVLDEAHMLCGQQEKQESCSSVIDLMTRGRKRGYCGVLCTQRISKLHKDAAAEGNNVMMGRTTLDVDVRRAADILGIPTKEAMKTLRELQPGEFFVFGPATDTTGVFKAKIGQVKTTHPKVGMDVSGIVIQPTVKIKKLISALADLPKREKDKIQQQRDYLLEIDNLKRELSAAKNNPQRERSSQVNVNAKLKRLKVQQLKEVKEYQRLTKSLELKLKRIAKILEVPTSIQSVKSEPAQLMPKPIPQESKIGKRLYNSSITTTVVKGGALRMLKAAVMFYPNPITRARMGALAGLSYKSGTFGTYLATLKREMAIEEQGGGFVATSIGLDMAGDVEPMPTDSESIISLWMGIVKGGAARMLRTLANYYPESISRELLGEEAEISSTSGTFGTYLATLKRNGLITQNGSLLKASDELFE